MIPLILSSLDEPFSVLVLIMHNVEFDRKVITSSLPYSQEDILFCNEDFLAVHSAFDGVGRLCYFVILTEPLVMMQQSILSLSLL